MSESASISTGVAGGQSNGLEIAIVGMAGRFPGARNIEAFWQNLCDGVEAISFFSEQELQDAGVPQSLRDDPHYVRAGGVLDDIESFDARFFGYTPREAEIMDPQQRIFLECAWEALENAGHTTDFYRKPIGVYAGVGMNGYLLTNLLANRDLSGLGNTLQLMLANDKDHLCTLIAYKMNLTGPGVTIQTACSTSLVAVHLACQGLLSGDCDMALAGGASIAVPHRVGYLYQEGSIDSPDGHCRAFDALAQGTVGGSGAGVVVLKRLGDALADGDRVYAVIKGSAINNDGANKVGYTAPGMDGQAKVIRAAQMIAGVDPETIGYVETHGTATSLGDPIEIAALTQAFRAGTKKKEFCAIGSLKTNVGHLDTAAGVAGLIKTALSLHHRKLVPSLHFERPNPQIDFLNSPFYVNTALSTWPAGSGARRAAVSSFGMGGTNAHAILEEAPKPVKSSLSRPWHVLSVSAKTATALETATRNLVASLKQNPSVDLADVAYTLQTGRKGFEHRRVVVCHDVDDAIDALQSLDPKRVLTGFTEAKKRPVVFLFPGQGAQYVQMGRQLYESEPVFRKHIDACAELLQPHLRRDLRQIIYPHEAHNEENQGLLAQTHITQPALFAIEYALAQLWIAWGLRPQAMIGHSVGEYVAACLAGVLSLEDALALVAGRGRLMQQLSPGAMLAVSLSEDEIWPRLGPSLSLAAINAPALCVVAGPEEEIVRLQHSLEEQGIQTRRLHTSHAFHSAMMEPMLGAFSELLQAVTLHAPKIPYLSNVTGTWITPAEATDPAYWVNHIRQTVRFAPALEALAQEAEWILLEVGPGKTLSAIVRQNLPKSSPQLVLTSMRHPQETQSDAAFLQNAAGRLWLAGAALNWPAFYAYEKRQRLALPTYPFERQKYWIAPAGQEHPLPTERAQPPAAPPPDVLANTPTHHRPGGIQGAYVAPRNEDERQIVAILQQSLGIEPVGVHDDFFELGGNSLIATHVITQLRQAFQMDLPMRVLFESLTAAKLAEYMLAARWAERDSQPAVEFAGVERDEGEL